MSASAFNALLKTLEEPPENVIFILCTTEPFKVLPTILSRCQRFDFSKISDDELKALLVRVLTSEKSIYDEDGLKAIISLADGGARDALSLLDQVLSYSGNELHEKDVLTLFGLASIEEKVSLLESINNGDVSSLIARTNSYVSGGIDIRRLTGDLIEILKDLLIFERTKDASLLSSLDEANAKVLASSIDFYKATSMLNSFIKTQNDFKNVNDVRSLFEVTILELATSDTQVKEHAAPVKSTPKPVVVPKEEVKVAPKEETIKPVEKPVVEEKKEEKVQPASIITFEKPKEEVKPVIEPEPKVEEKAPISGRPSKEMFAAPPDFLFEEEKPAPKPVTKSSIDIAKILKPAIAVQGAQNEISDDEIVKIMVLADKAERTKLLKKWDEFALLKGDPKLGNLATLLSEGHPYCLAKEALILCFDFKRLRDKANIIENQEALEEMVEQLLGRKVFIYAIDPVERNRLSGTYFSLMQLGKMPKKSEIVLNLPNGKKEK
jgi:DNA polymerase-3 subunit gamma/tau